MWIKIGELHPEQDAPWVATTPAFVGATVTCGSGVEAPLAMVPLLLDTATEDWPTPVLQVRASDVDVARPIPQPEAPSIVSVFVENTGLARAYGITIDVITGSDERTMSRSRFVRDIAAGGSSWC